jgi:predicted DNA-binding transcriptional regulator YafY
VRAARLVQLLLLLQVHRKLTASQLAERLEVSVRTIYRDMEALSGAGVPVFAEPGPGGGCTLVDGYHTRLTGLTPDEAEALALAGLPGAAADLGLGTVLAAAQLKVDAALPPELRRRAVRVRERFHLDAPGWFSRDESTPHLATLAHAVWDERRVQISYARGDGPVERTIDPLGLVLKGGKWYLVAGVGGDRARTYRVSRVESAQLQAESVRRPEGFDLAAYWAASAEEFAQSMLRHEVIARVRADRLGALRFALEPAAADRAIASAGHPDADGWVKVTVPTESFDYAHDDLLRLGAAVEVLAPPELRDRLAATARAMAERYGAKSPS